MPKQELTQEAALAALSKVEDPALGKDLIALDAVRDLRIKGADVSLRLVLATPAHPFAQQIENKTQAALEKAGAAKVKLEMDAEVPADGRQRAGLAPGLKNAGAVG